MNTKYFWLVEISLAATAGGGFGFWFSQHLTSRLELRYLNYESERLAGAANMKLMVANFGLGYLL
jgi:hypothetical protein